MPSSKESSRPRDETHISLVSALAGGFSTTSATWEAPRYSEADNLDPLLFPTTHPIPHLAGRESLLFGCHVQMVTNRFYILPIPPIPAHPKTGVWSLLPNFPKFCVRPSLLKCCLGVVMKGGLTVSVGGF